MTHSVRHKKVRGGPSLRLNLFCPRVSSESIIRRDTRRREPGTFQLIVSSCPIFLRHLLFKKMKFFLWSVFRYLFIVILIFCLLVILPYNYRIRIDCNVKHHQLYLRIVTGIPRFLLDLALDLNLIFQCPLLLN